MRTSDQSRNPQLGAVTLEPVSPVDREPFLEMAVQHFRELNPSFVVQEDWKRDYFEGILGNPRLSLRWVVADGGRAGFVLFGIEDHKFLPRRSGIVYELYISPEFRLRGLARASAQQAIDELQRHSPSKVQLEIMEHNRGAAALWTSLGFEKVAERWVLRKNKT
jgi:ribosomal protein S18 acetylase RimI-like enzyme